MEETKKAEELFKWVNLVGLIFFLVSVFMGLIYVLHGNIVLDAIISLVTFLVLWFLSSILRDFKTKKKNVDDNTAETVVGIAYLIIALVSSLFIFHFIDMDFSQKDSIKAQGNAKLTEARHLEDNYRKAVQGKVNIFTTAVETEARSFLNSPVNSNKEALLKTAGSSISDGDFNRYRSSGRGANEKMRFMSVVHGVEKDRGPIIEAKYDLATETNDLNTFCASAQAVFDGWQILKISYYYNNIDAETQKFYQAAKAKMPDFQYSAPVVNNLVIDKVFDSISHSSIVQILVIYALIILLHIIILLPYLTATRVRAALSRKGKEAEKSKVKGAVNI